MTREIISYNSAIIEVDDRREICLSPAWDREFGNVGSPDLVWVVDIELTVHNVRCNLPDFTLVGLVFSFFLRHIRPISCISLWTRP